MSLLSKIKKLVFHPFSQGVFGAYIVTVFIGAIGVAIHQGLMPSARLKNYEDFKLAKNINQYFNYLSQKTINRSSEVDWVIPLQEALSLLGYNLGECGNDGIFGDDVEAAVSFFQDDNDLFATGEADPKTLLRLKKLILADKGVEGRLDKVLLEPYRTKKVIKLVSDLPQVMESQNWSLMFFPDIMTLGFYESAANSKRQESASVVFPGCTNNHLRDGFRHSESMFNIAKRSFSSADLAVKVGDLREKVDFHTLPLFLMDVFNHRVAIDIYKERKAAGLDMTDTANIFVENIKNGRFAIYPFPLVPKNSL